jgi:ribosome maturation factor RimP|tara:strand:+ start:36 stop:503 length:468 start_codon:yes stop_codon:yes gene_type:complete
MKDLVAVSKIEKFLFKNLNPIFLDTKYEIIRIKVYEAENKIVQIMIDHSNKIIDIEDCAKYSRIISEVLDKNKIISNDFNLEVSSPGINRPLTRLKDFHKSKGNKVKITQINLENKKINYRGILTEVTETSILLDQNDNVVSIKLDKICDAKLLV